MLPSPERLTPSSPLQNFQTRLMHHPDGEGKRYHDSTVKSGAEAPRQCALRMFPEMLSVPS